MSMSPDDHHATTRDRTDHAPFLTAHHKTDLATAVEPTHPLRPPSQGLVYIGDVQVNRKARATERPWSADAVLRIFIRQHDDRRPDLDFSVADSPAWLRQAELLFRVERARISCGRSRWDHQPLDVTVERRGWPVPNYCHGPCWAKSGHRYSTGGRAASAGSVCGSWQNAIQARSAPVHRAGMPRRNGAWQWPHTL